jgi:hypothetical protein
MEVVYINYLSAVKTFFTVLLTTPIFPGEDLRIGLIFD